MRSTEACFLFSVLLLVAVTGGAQGSEQGVETELSELSLAEIDRKLNNPLADILSLTFQNNAGINEGDAVDSSEYCNDLFFQPFMPFGLSKSKSTMLTLRPG